MDLRVLALALGLTFSASAAEPLHFALGLRGGLPLDDLRSPDAFQLGAKPGVGLDLQGGFRLYGTDGLELGVHSMVFPLHTRTFQGIRFSNEASFAYGKVGYGLDLVPAWDLRGVLAVGYGTFKLSHSQATVLPTPDGPIEMWSTQQRQDGRVPGFSLALRQRVYRRLWAEVGYNQFHPASDHFGASALKWVDVGLKAIW